MSDSDRPSKHVLIVDDERNVRLTYRVALATEGFQIAEAESGVEALEKLRATAYDLVILDMRMPGMDGIEVLRAMGALGITTPVVVITAFGDVPHAVEAMKCGAIDFLQKPITPDDLRAIVHEVLSRHHPSFYRLPSDEFEAHLYAAKRLINQREFAGAKEHLIKALELNGKSPDALNLAGVLSEMQEDYNLAEKYYKRALNSDAGHEAAQSNMRRILERLYVGPSEEPFDLGNNQTA